MNTLPAAGLAASGIGDILSHPFMQHAFVAGTAIAAACGLVGYFVVLRSQVFSTDALSHVAFAGALAALAAGVDPRIGLFGGTVVVAVAIGVLGNRGRADDVVIGTVFTWILGLGVLFLSIYTTAHGAENGTANVSVLFGSIFGLNLGQATIAAVVGIGLCIGVVCIARPLLFASVDESVAAARGLRVRALGIGFLVLVGVCAAEATQAVGALLLVGLVAAPAGTAHRLTGRPWIGLALSTAIAIGSLWLGLVVSYLYGSVPASFSIMAVATSAFAATFVPRRRFDEIVSR
ncbi:MAG: zinc/manganese transport system permease protein [Actinomycetota bacterium]|nr:zinc/manganese transport system permease protein [Actinomycetota bacterium]